MLERVVSIIHTLCHISIRKTFFSVIVAIEMYLILPNKSFIERAANPQKESGGGPNHFQFQRQ